MVITVRNNKGFSLIELLIALVILQLSLLGLLAVMTNSINANLNNEFRNTAIRLTAQTAEALYGVSFNDNWATDTTGTGIPHVRINGNTDQDLKGFPQVLQNIRGGFQQTYNISWTVTDQSPELKEIVITVQYNDRRVGTFSNNAVIYKHLAL